MPTSSQDSGSSAFPSTASPAASSMADDCAVASCSIPMRPLLAPARPRVDLHQEVPAESDSEAAADRTIERTRYGQNTREGVITQHVPQALDTARTGAGAGRPHQPPPRLQLSPPKTRAEIVKRFFQAQNSRRIPQLFNRELAEEETYTCALCRNNGPASGGLGADNGATLHECTKPIPIPGASDGSERIKRHTELRGRMPEGWVMKDSTGLYCAEGAEEHSKDKDETEKKRERDLMERLKELKIQASRMYDLDSENPCCGYPVW
ncbi:hypothetical protein P280DRAFT_89133 [Massarina eburnea CBS 473.64]|uniref:Uncharacterized protein n=1 Tax=Massarina eburnea CBS 473.64 TaxID=1395130 RepID=A0A6A6RVM2_9PLEO|nr:hypothetical protein P280DRAFT_89133 [Massarina eburnea CBS 473.64]